MFAYIQLHTNVNTYVCQSMTLHKNRKVKRACMDLYEKPTAELWRVPCHVGSRNTDEHELP